MHFAPPTPSLNLPCAVPNFMAIPTVTANPHTRWYKATILIVYHYSVEIVLRAEAVETAQAGDKCDFTGTLIVVPDVSSLSVPGEC